MTKTIKKVISFMVAVTMVMMLGLSSFAATYSISITRSANDKASHTYKAYQIFTGETYNDGTTTTLVNLQPGSNLNFATLKTQLGLASTATMADVVAGLKAISEADAAKKIQASIKDTPAPLEAVSGASLTTTISAVPGPGYYLITDTIDRTNTAPDGLQGAESSFMLQVLNEDTAITVNAKTDVPTLDKVIDEGAGVEANTASLGDDVPFKLTSKVPDTSKYNRYWFKVTDVLSKGLTFNDDMVIKVGTKTLVKDTDYTLTEEADTPAAGQTTLGIVFKNFKQYALGSDIVITYSAKLIDEADRTDAGNDNVAKLIFSNNPNQTYTGDNPDGSAPTGETPNKRTVTYTTGLAIRKIDENGKPLPGAKFTITGTTLNRVATFSTTFTPNASGTYYKLKDGTYTTAVPDGTNDDLYESVSTKYTKTEATTVADSAPDSATFKLEKVSDSTGYVSFEGLKAGTYTIVESEAPTGYKKSDNVYQFVIGSEPTLTSPGWTISYGAGATTGLTIDNANVNTAGPILYSFTVQNFESHDLPITGGMGTTAFYIAGSALLLAGTTLLIAKKKNIRDSRSGS